MATSVAFELFALRLEAYGPGAIDPAAARLLARGPQWLELRNLLRSYGLTRAEIAMLTGRRHPQGCACWQCVLALHRRAMHHRNKLDREASKRRPRLSR